MPAGAGQIANIPETEEAASAPADEAIHVLFVAVSLLGFAGSSLRYRRYFPLMRRQGVLPRVVTLPPTHRKRIGAPAVPEGRGPLWRGEVDGTPMVVVRTDGENKSWSLFRLFARAMRESAAQRGPLTLHVLQQLKSDTLLHSLMLRLSRRPKVLSVTKDVKLPGTRRERWLQRIQFDCFDAIFCQSNDQFDALRRIGVRARVHQLPNGVDTERHRPADAAERRVLREDLGLPLDEPVFVYAGSIQERKGVDLLLEAWRDLCGQGRVGRLVLIGPRYDLDDPADAEFGAGLAASMRGPGMAESVIFTGTLPDVTDYLRAADGFVFPSRREGVPNAVLEAMACGLPCVLTSFSDDMSQFGTPGEHYLLCERDPGTIADAIAQIAADLAGARSSFGARARSRMVDTMRLDRAVDRHCEIYRALARGAGAVRR